MFHNFPIENNYCKITILAINNSIWLRAYLYILIILSSVLFSIASFAALINDVNDKNDSLGDGIFFIIGDKGNFLVEPGDDTDAS